MKRKRCLVDATTGYDVAELQQPMENTGETIRGSF
jgi:hypothetical protein